VELSGPKSWFGEILGSLLLELTVVQMSTLSHWVCDNSVLLITISWPCS